jgi:hypothetical protein
MSELTTVQPSSPQPYVVRSLALSLLELPIAAGMGFLACWGFATTACAVAKCQDLQGIPYLLMGAVAGVIVAIGFWATAFAIRRRRRRRLIWDGAALLALLTSGALVAWTSYRERAAHEAEIAHQQQQFTDLRNAWIDRLRHSAHGPPGVVPPMLRVILEGTTVMVTNASEQELVVTLARVLPDAEAPGGWRACTLRVPSGTPPSIAPGKSLRYEDNATCDAAVLNGPLEYRVGHDHRDVGWWSDSAFAAPDGRP